MAKFKRLTALPLIAALALAGCEGDDGNTGPAGPAGPAGQQGEPAPTANPVSVTLLHINDHHSHLAPLDFDYDVSGLGLTDAGGDPIDEVEVTYGGFPMMVSLFKTLESQAVNPLKLHAGDAITGTSFYSLFDGVADADLMNQICFDAFALGNHEFDDGDAGLANFLDALNSTGCVTPALAANVAPGATSAIAEGYIQPRTIIERDGEQIGIVGLVIAGKTKNSSQPDEDTLFADEITTAQAQIDELAAEGVNKIILLTHYGYDNDQALAAAVTGVDVIVGGDSHSLLGDTTFEDLGFNPVGDYPTMTTDAGGDPVCIVQAWEYARLMGRVEVDFDADGVLTRCEGTPLMPISGTYAGLTSPQTAEVNKALTAEDEIVIAQDDFTTAQLLAGFEAERALLVQTVIGTVAENLCLERFPGQGRSAICDRADTYEQGSDISNLVAKAFMQVTPTADFAIQNGGGVRVDVAAGDHTIDNAITLLPFSNTLVTLTMTGAEIVQVLDEAVGFGVDPDGSTGAYPYASGLRYDVDASAAAGARVTNVEVNPRVAGTWAPIDPAATYVVVTNSFIAAGRDGYVTFGTVSDAGNALDTFTEYSQSWIDFVEAETAAGRTLMKLPADEYSTKTYIGRGGCNHSTTADCASW